MFEKFSDSEVLVVLCTHDVNGKNEPVLVTQAQFYAPGGTLSRQTPFVCRGRLGMGSRASPRNTCGKED